MGYHHLALAARDMAAVHHFYEDVMGFELVKVEVAPVLLWKDSGLVRRARQTGGRGEARKPVRVPFPD